MRGLFTAWLHFKIVCFYLGESKMTQGGRHCEGGVARRQRHARSLCESGGESVAMMLHSHHYRITPFRALHLVVRVTFLER